MGIRVTPTEIPEVLLVEPDVFRDQRGFFLEAYHQARFAAAGITDEFVQDNHSRSVAGVLRGFHYQDLSAPMSKLVRCTAGRILDVALDLRVGSPTFGQCAARELTSENMRMLYVPVGFGHAFCTLSETAEVQYKCGGLYAPQAEGAIRWDDADVAFNWPVSAPLVSEKDARAATLDDYRRSPAFTY